MSEHEYKILLRRQQQSRATTPSAYLRALAVAGREPIIPAWETLRDMRNEAIRLTAAITASPPGPVRDRALEAAINALDRITRF